MEFEFTGENGNLFDKMLNAIGLNRKDICIYTLFNSCNKSMTKFSNSEICHLTKNNEVLLA